MKLIQQKLEGWGRLPYGENFIILTLTVFLWSTHLTGRRRDRQTDRRDQRLLRP